MKRIIFFFAMVAIAGHAFAELQWGTATPAYEAEIAAEYAPYLKAGKNILTGQAFLTQKGGGVVKAAGREVTLDPATSTGTEWWKRAGTSWENRVEEHSSVSFRKARRSVIADADGRFTFKDLPAGRYYLRTDVTWEIGSEIQGGLVGALVEVKDGVATEIILGGLNIIAIAVSPVLKVPEHTSIPKVSAQTSMPQISTKVPTLDEMLSSGQPQQMKEAAENIFKGKKFQPERLELLHSIIEKNYKQPLGKDYIEAIVWLCKALAASGAIEHKPLIEDVAQNASEVKIRKHVKQYLEFYKN